MPAAMKAMNAELRSTWLYPLKVVKMLSGFSPGWTFGHGFGDQQVEEEGHDAADDGVHDEQGEERFTGHKAADGGTDDPGEVADDAQDAETLLALVFRQYIRDHRAVCRPGDIGEQTDADGQRNEG